jgi:shikimate kinase
MPGSGKSTVGRQLSRRLNWPFVDSDMAIEQELGCSIRSFFEQHGEAAFREVEQRVIARLLDAPLAVLATGGGAVLRDENRHQLSARSHVVYLRSSPEELFRRLRHDTHRPLLQVADPLRRLRELYRERDPLYRNVARFVIETGRPTVKMLVGMILMQLELAGIVGDVHAPGADPAAAPGAGDH